VSKSAPGQPGWLMHIDKVSSAFLLRHGTPTAVLLAVVCVLAAASTYRSPKFMRFMIAVVAVAFAVVWIAVQNLGGILAGGATDPNSGPLVVLLALLYWPAGPRSGAQLGDHALVRVAGD